ncbi:Xaa-Pro dipeptidyl-peptidase [Pseudonocardiaceae bacterium YIM PH 21723]|nr:Xaa-Pro dipeptidyl-peptidase [Pseudonocardiaceae bacterium YIM PH 21723]
MRALLTLLSATALSAGLVIPAQATPAFELDNGVSTPIHSFADAIRETVYVDTGLDLDKDGKTDRVATDIIRPDTTAKVPVIMDASPYYSCCGRGNESEKKTYDSAGKPVKFPLFLDNYFVPRGYAVVLVDLAGTNRSSGCVDVGGRSDIDSARRAVDWLNGRVKAYSSLSGGSEVSASWSTGAVGMIGKSYDGTIANGVAASGVDGLKTIVPVGAISSWYDYYRSDGVSFGFDPLGLSTTVDEGKKPLCTPVKTELSQGATANGDQNAFWDARDYVPDASKVKATVFAIHGINDQNVKTINFGQWWDKITTTKKTWLSGAGHVDPFDLRRATYVDTLNRWFDRWLLNVQNGIENQPLSTVERAPDSWTDEASWPAPGAKPTELKLGTGGVLGPTAGTGSQSFTEKRGGFPAWAKTGTNANRLLFSTPTLDQDVRLSGTGSITLTVTTSTPTSHLSAALVDYGPQTIRNYTGSGEGITTLSTESCWGESRTGDDACYKDTKADVSTVDLDVFGRGWTDLRNYQSLRSEQTITPGKAYTITFRLATMDHVVPKGHKLGLIIGGSEQTVVAAKTPGKVDVSLTGSKLVLPIAGAIKASTVDTPIRGERALTPATAPKGLDRP